MIGKASTQALPSRATSATAASALSANNQPIGSWASPVAQEAFMTIHDNFCPRFVPSLRLAFFINNSKLLAYGKLQRHF